MRRSWTGICQLARLQFLGTGTALIRPTAHPGTLARIFHEGRVGLQVSVKGTPDLTMWIDSYLG